jgi:hypothetical protein
MFASSNNLSLLQRFCGAPFLSSCLLRCVSSLALTLAANSLYSQATAEAPQGVAWQVRGSWQVDGKDAQIRNGDAIQPGALLHPEEVTTRHSILVLLPDGQSVFYECFTAQDCGRGFRVPSLDLNPEPFAVDLLARVRATLVREIHDPSGPDVQRTHPLPRDEVVCALDSDNRVQIAGLAARLPNGRYTYDLQPLDRSNPRQFHLAIEKSGPSIAVSVPSTGLYIVTIADDQNRPRIDLFVAAVNSARAPSVTQSARQAKALMRKWIEIYYGWPIHAFEWAYVESLVSDAEPSGTGGERVTAPLGSPAGSGVDSARTTAEPAFSPQPGWLKGDAAIAIRSDTPGATVHYTVDSSLPVAGSPVYGAPIIVKAKGLTVMAFASAPGKKDSAVVTANFRIQQDSH